MIISSLFLSLALQPAPAQADAQAKQEEEVVCRRIAVDRNTGSNLRRASKRKICRTESEWADADRQKDEFFDAMNRNQGAGGEQGAAAPQ